MDSPSSNSASNQPIEEETQTPNQNQNQNQSRSRSPSVGPIDEKAMVPVEAADPEPALDQEDDHQLAIPEEDREYGCKFCDKKFSNKQALGGHQNAHKIERSVEKTSRDMHETAVGYFSATSAPSNPQPPILNTYPRNDLLMNRAYISWPAYYNHRPLIQMPDPNYGPRPLFNNVYQPGWAQPPARLPFIPNNPNYLNQAAYMGFQRPVYDLPPPPAVAFPGPLRLGPERNPEINFANLRGEDYDEAGLDLTLRL